MEQYRNRSWVSHWYRASTTVTSSTVFDTMHSNQCYSHTDTENDVQDPAVDMALVTMYCIKNDEWVQIQRLHWHNVMPYLHSQIQILILIPVISPELKSESNSVKFEKFCIVQWSHLVCSPNSRSESISESDNAIKPLTLTLSVITVLCGGRRVGASTAK